MTRDQLAEHMEMLFEECQWLRAQGQKEYAHADDNPFRNFEALGDDLNLPREKVLWVYLKKHLDGILAWINGHRSQRESVKGRIKDAIVYLVILDAMGSDSELADIFDIDAIPDGFEVFPEIRYDGKPILHGHDPDLAVGKVVPGSVKQQNGDLEFKVDPDPRKWWSGGPRA